MPEIYLPVAYAIFIVSGIVFGLLFLFLFFYPTVRRFLYKNYTIRMYYHRVNRVVLDRDFYLINNFANKTADEEEFHIDHIMIGEKYIYCIRDRYYTGTLRPEAEDDAKWGYYQKKRFSMIGNPIYLNSVRVSRLSMLARMDQGLFISIVLVNDECVVTPYEAKSDWNFIVSLRNFPKLIAELERRKVNPLDPDLVAIVARDFAELNFNGR